MIKVDNREFYVNISDMGEISFYTVENHIDPWSLEREQKFHMDSFGTMKNPVKVIRLIIEEIKRQIYINSEPFVYYTPTCEKRKRIYMKFLKKYKPEGYEIQEAGDKIYLCRQL